MHTRARYAAEAFGSASGKAVVAEHDRIEALQAILAAIFAEAVHLHGLNDARIMRYAGVRYGYHLAAVEDAHDLYVAGSDMNRRLLLVQQERGLEVLWQPNKNAPRVEGRF